MVTVSAFRWVPPFAQGYVRDLRVRWALEEAGIPYEVELIDHDTTDTKTYRAWQPFGQVPALRDGEIEMFESGAIVLYLAQKSATLAPRDDAGRARVMTWVLAALNSIEPHAQGYIQLDAAPASEAWSVRHRAQVEATLTKTLAALEVALGEKEYLDSCFTAGDLMMASVLRELVECGMLARFPLLDAYRCRCEARPAFINALADQMAVFDANAPAAA